MRYSSVLFVGAPVTSVGTGPTAFGLASHLFQSYRNASAVAAARLCAFAPLIHLETTC